MACVFITALHALWTSWHTKKLSLVEQIEAAKKVRDRIIEIARSQGDDAEADRLAGKQGTGSECYPGIDNMKYFATLLQQDYDISATVGYDVVGSDMGTVTVPNDSTLPPAYVVIWNKRTGADHFDLVQSWISTMDKKRSHE